jgi:thiamine-phosphate pyrophosphorylase
MVRPHGASLIVNDRTDIALMGAAHGVHLGQEDARVAEARGLAGARLAIGVSTENLEQARRAALDGADYCGVGPMFPSTTKDKPRLAGPECLREYLADPLASSRPHLAIGGITPDNIDQLVRVGCRGVAVSAAVCSAPQPDEAVAALLAPMRPSSSAASQPTPSPRA